MEQAEGETGRYQPVRSLGQRQRLLSRTKRLADERPSCRHRNTNDLLFFAVADVDATASGQVVRGRSQVQVDVVRKDMHAPKLFQLFCNEGAPAVAAGRLCIDSAGEPQPRLARLLFYLSKQAALLLSHSRYLIIFLLSVLVNKFNDFMLFKAE